MSYTRNTIKSLSSLFYKKSLSYNKIFNPSFPIAPSMTTAYDSNPKIADTKGMLNFLMDVVNRHQIFNDKVVNNAINKATIHCFQHSLELAKKYFADNEFLQAGEQATQILVDLDKAYGKITLSSPDEIKTLTINALMLQSEVYKNGTFRQNKIALNALKAASKLAPNDNNIKKAYDSLLIEWGGTPENQQIFPYSEPSTPQMKK